MASEDRCVIGLSVGPVPEHDRVARGIDSKHVDAIVFRIVHTILALRCDVSYGGNLGPAGFTDKIRALVRGEQDDIEVKQRPTLINFLAAPKDEALTVERIAEDLGVVRYVRIPLPDAAVRGSEETADLRRVGWHAHAMSAMRGAMHADDTKDIDGRPLPRPRARIVLGGKTSGYSGFLPGVIEETCAAIEAQVPVFVLGIVGGAAGCLARYLLDREGEAAAFEGAFAEHRTTEQFAHLHAACVAAGDPTLPEMSLRRAMKQLSGPRPANGLTPEEDRRLMAAQDADTAITLLRKGLAELISPKGEG